MTNNDALADLRDMLEDVDREEDCAVFNHTPEEIGIEVMKNHEAILAALRSTPQPKPLDPPAQDEVEAVARALAKSHGVDFDEPCGMGEDGDGDCDSSTCVAASFEDHEVDYARQYYRGLATAAIAALDQHRTTPSAPQSSDAVEQPASRSPSPEKTPGVEAAGGEGEV